LVRLDWRVAQARVPLIRRPLLPLIAFSNSPARLFDLSNPRHLTPHHVWPRKGRKGLGQGVSIGSLGPSPSPSADVLLQWR
jgi:hypothetical protein